MIDKNDSTAILIGYNNDDSIVFWFIENRKQKFFDIEILR